MHINFNDMNFFNICVVYRTSSKNVLVLVVNSPLLILTFLSQYLGRFDVIPVFQSEEEMEHWILPRQDIISSYVVEVRETGREEREREGGRERERRRERSLKVQNNIYIITSPV